MTDTIEQKALALVNEVATPGHVYDLGNLAQSRPFKALLRAIERHEAFRQEVSEFALGVKEYMQTIPAKGWVAECDAFIIPKPVDPLVEILRAACTGMEGTYSYEELADAVSAIGKARGYEFTKIGEKAGDA